MFNGIINYLSKIFFLKYFVNFNFMFLKINNFFNFNIGDSFSLNGVCLTLIYKCLFFLEFDFSYLTFLNICFLKNLIFNFEKSINIFKNISGNLLYGHINNIFLIKNKFYFLNNIKIYFIFLLIFRKYILYKLSISLNGISLTINEILYFKNFIIISLNILKFTYFFTNLKFMNCFEKINLEFDFFINYLLNKIF